MLATLELRDFAIVESLQLELAPGFNVLTGETGAGKSILVDALSLLTGVRADTGMIRSGKDSALVQGVFTGVGIGSAARTLQRNGRHHARIDGELVSVTELSERGGEVVGIFAQHAALALSSPARQRDQLDRLMSEADRNALTAYRVDHARLAAVEERLAELSTAVHDRVRRAELLDFQIREIRAAAPVSGEMEALQAELRRLRHAERILLGTGRAFEALAGADDESLQGATQPAATALRELREVARYEPQVAPLADDLAQAVDALHAVAAELETFLTDFQADPERLEAVQARLATLETLSLKFGGGIDEVLAYLAEAEAERARLRQADADLDSSAAERDRLRASLEARAERFTAARRRAATALEERVLPSLEELGMTEARFEVQVTPTSALGPAGRDEVRFMLGTNAGEPLAPLADVASGGELSRVMLALHVVTGSTLPVLVFDEVDAGIGGATARSVGAMLRRLSREHQVLVVTHLPQVAAAADAQYLVTKELREGRTITHVTRLGRETRRAELARMLSGSVTDLSLQHAAELLESAAGTPNEAR